MKRGIVLGTLTIVGALSLAVAGYQQPAQAPAPKVVEVEKIRDNLFMLKGGGGNTAVYIGANGVVVVDTKNAGWGAPVIAKIKELTPKPVTMLINTHSHGDHVSGNVEFPATVDVVAQENTKKVVEEWPPVYGLTNAFPNVFKESKGVGMMKRTFKDKMSVGTGDDRIDLSFYGCGHTGGDAWVLFPKLRVLHAGDMFAGKTLPIMDKNAGGCGVAYADTLTKAYNALNKDVDTIITGHSTTMKMADLKTYGDFNRDFVAFVKEAKAAGKTPEQVAATWKTPEKYTPNGYPAAAAPRAKADAEVVMGELK